DNADKARELADKARELANKARNEKPSASESRSEKPSASDVADKARDNADKARELADKARELANKSGQEKGHDQSKGNNNQDRNSGNDNSNDQGSNVNPDAKPLALSEFISSMRKGTRVSSGAATASSLDLSYSNGWKEQIVNGRYVLVDPNGNTIVSRTVRNADIARLQAILK
ncbi:hypothetical protein MNBD_ALPHA12-559, partial [hydrothermal vent metagenome]